MKKHVRKRRGNTKMKYQLMKIQVLSILLLLWLIPIGSAIPGSETQQANYVNNGLGENSPVGSSNLEYDLLILAPEYFHSALVPLVEHKELVGMSTNLVDLEEVYEQMDVLGRDNPEKIKYFIKFAIEEWGIQYVLLIGGMIGQWMKWHLPVRYVQMDCNWEHEYISDLYYADIYDSGGNFSTWDSDGDGVFGEWYYEQIAEDQNIDLTPDIAIGRLPCRNTFEVKEIVKKIIYYEQNTYGQSWFSDMIVVAGDTYPESNNPLWKGYEGEYYGDRALENMSDFTPTRLYTSDGTFTDANDVRLAVNNGCGFLYLVGHGSPKKWGNNMPDGDGFADGLSTQNVHRLNNRNKYPICVLSGCHNLQFDVTILKMFNADSRWRQENIFESIGWRLTWNIGGGSIATVGTTALGFTKEDKEAFNGGINEIEVAFFTQYGQMNKTILGDTWMGAVQWYIDTYPVDWNTNSTDDSWIDAQVVQTWILFGDPSLQIGGYPIK
jgi:hypothetical protein